MKMYQYCTDVTPFLSIDDRCVEGSYNPGLLMDEAPMFSIAPPYSELPPAYRSDNILEIINSKQNRSQYVSQMIGHFRSKRLVINSRPTRK